MIVRFEGPSDSSVISNHGNDNVAQWLKCWTPKMGVVGSSPAHACLGGRFTSWYCT